MNAGFVRRRIPKHPKGALHEVREPALLAPFTNRRARIDCQHRRFAAQNPINQRSAIICKASAFPHLACDAFDCLLHGVKIVLSEQLRSAELEDVRVHAASLKIAAQLASTSLGFGQCLRSLNRCEFAGLIDDQTTECQGLIGQRPHRLVPLRVS